MTPHFSPCEGVDKAAQLSGTPLPRCRPGDACEPEPKCPPEEPRPGPTPRAEERLTEGLDAALTDREGLQRGTNTAREDAFPELPAQSWQGKEVPRGRRRLGSPGDRATWAAASRTDRGVAQGASGLAKALSGPGWVRAGRTGEKVPVGLQGRAAAGALALCAGFRLC